MQPKVNALSSKTSGYTRSKSRFKIPQKSLIISTIFFSSTLSLWFLKGGFHMISRKLSDRLFSWHSDRCGDGRCSAWSLPSEETTLRRYSECYDDKPRHCLIQVLSRIFLCCSDRGHYVGHWLATISAFLLIIKKPFRIGIWNFDMLIALIKVS